MKHARPEDLKEVEPLLIQIRRINNLKEKQTGHFYFRGINIVHFHIDNSRIFIDIGDSRTEIIFTDFAAQIDRILLEVRKYMQEVSQRKK
ncbi:MAG: hypothetical protein RE471_05910 [Ferroplasma sp.]|uniref:hypothetical protein n=1 Tax=Ferroplasma sp. TaxID=2591003 RepID=UPI0028161709|nr:hypothetical protein [Ferroplasma sp.]WMT50515.1 MAG: hypothetical protein RE471_05910 [Ferroplasma sp.]